MTATRRVILGLALLPGLLPATAVLPACAQAPDAGAGPGLVAASAEARRRLPATVSDALATIEVHGRDLRGTTTLLAQRSQTLLDYLGGEKVERLRTEDTSLEPELQDARGQPDRIKGYTGRGTVSFRTLPDRLPALLAGSLEHGATGVVQSGSVPREAEVETARQELAAEATRTALARAGAMAAAADTRLGAIQRIDADLSGGPGFAAMAAMRKSSAPMPAPPVASAAGEMEVVVRVSVTVRLVQDR
jgi:uncharacterized protein YggE